MKTYTMKKAKRLCSLLMALALVATMFAGMTFAAAAADTGTIQIVGFEHGATYTLYRILNADCDLESGTYYYSMRDPAAETGDTTGLAALNTVIAEYFDGASATMGSVSLKDDKTIEEAAKALYKAIEENNVAPVETKEAPEVVLKGQTFTFTDLSQGYYLIKSSSGTIVMADTMDSSDGIVRISNKQESPTITYEVYDKASEAWATETNASYEEDLQWRITVNAMSGAEGYEVLLYSDNYVVNLRAQASSTYKVPSYIDNIVITLNGVVVPEENYTISDRSTKKTNLQAITFTQAFCDTLIDDDTLVISHDMPLSAYGKTITASAKLSYGTESTVEASATATSYKLGLVKTKTDGALLDGASFKLYDAEGNEMYFQSESNGTAVATGYIYCAGGERDGLITTFAVNNGQAEITGLGAGTYYLEEITAPDGYQKLTERKEIIVTGDNLATIEDGTYVSGGVQVINELTGTELPSTGGNGAVMFYVFGTILVLAAAALLVIKRRQNAENR